MMKQINQTAFSLMQTAGNIGDQSEELHQAVVNQTEAMLGLNSEVENIKDNLSDVTASTKETCERADEIAEQIADGSQSGRCRQGLCSGSTGSKKSCSTEYGCGKEYVTITVKNGEIVAAEYNAENASGFIKSWDNAYMNNMKPVSGTYPNEYTRYYAAQLTGQTSVPEIETLTGATSSGANFRLLAQAVVEQALKGDSTVAIVESQVTEE